jgi:hypothetical protein
MMMMIIGAGPHACDVLSYFCRNSRRCFMLCLVYMSCFILVLGSGGKDYIIRSFFPPDEGGRVQSPKSCFK